MTTPPVCSIHHEPMRSGKGGAFFCPKKLADGSWCTEKVAAPKGAGGITSPTVATTGDVLRAAALSFAATLYRGAGPEMADDAIALAKRAFQEMSQ